MIKCIECGFENPDGSDTCLNCGAKLVQKKISQAMDDISAEATVMLGGPAKNPYAAPPSPAKGVEEPPAPPSQQQAAPPPREPAKPVSAPPPPPAAPNSRNSEGLGAGMIFLVVAGGVFVAGILLFILFRLVT